jgi:metal-dependent amidase/aminoacylase/carboxypeptidase family protein
MREAGRTYMSVQDQILHAIDTAADRVIEASRQIHEHPELHFQEHFAAKTLTGAL